MTKLELRLFEALKAWEDFDKESEDRHPCPDYKLRAMMRKRARRLTQEIMEAQDAK